MWREDNIDRALKLALTSLRIEAKTQNDEGCKWAQYHFIPNYWKSS